MAKRKITRAKRVPYCEKSQSGSGDIFFAKTFFWFVFFGLKKNERSKIQNPKSKIMTTLTFNDLPTAVQTLIEQLQTLNQKIDNLPKNAPPQDENRYVDINEIRQLVFRQWKRQTIYNKCYLGELPHSRVGGRLLFHLKECREWQDSQLQQGKVRALSQIDEEAQALFDSHKNRNR